jgi:hypothetical protein
MTDRVVKRAIFAASLGLAMFLSGPAHTGTDEVFFMCVEDVETGELRVEKLFGSSEVLAPPEFTLGAQCLDLFTALKEDGWERALTLMSPDDSATRFTYFGYAKDSQETGWPDPPMSYQHPSWN